MYIDQISVYVENRKGSLANVTGILNAANIDLRAFCVADTTDFGILRLIVNDPDKTLNILLNAGVAVSKTKVIVARLKDQPGGLHAVLEVLSAHSIGVEYAYAFLSPTQGDAFAVLRVEPQDTAAQVLHDHNITLMKPEDIYTL